MATLVTRWIGDFRLAPPELLFLLEDDFFAAIFFLAVGRFADFLAAEDFLPRAEDFFAGRFFADDFLELDFLPRDFFAAMNRPQCWRIA